MIANLVLAMSGNKKYIPDCFMCINKEEKESEVVCIAQGYKDTKRCYGTLECYGLYEKEIEEDELVQTDL